MPRSAGVQGMTGCAANMWRYEPDGYLREILTARVYDVAVSGSWDIVVSCGVVWCGALRHCEVEHGGRAVKA